MLNGPIGFILLANCWSGCKDKLLHNNDYVVVLLLLFYVHEHKYIYIHIYIIFKDYIQS